MSRIHLIPFEYYEPKTLSEASNLLVEYGDKAQVMAGGIDLIPRMRQGSIDAKQVINIQNIPELKYFNFDYEKGLEFGAMTTLHELELSNDMIENYPELQKSIHQITSVQTKYMGTAVGNIALATPATDVGPALMAYDAELLIYGPQGERREVVKDFYVDYRKSSLKLGEIIKGIFIPITNPNTGAAFINRNRTHGDIAKISVTCLLSFDGDKCTKARICLGSVAAKVVRAEEAEKVLENQVVTEELIEKASYVMQENLHPITDLRSTAEYRFDVTRVLVERALHKAFEQGREIKHD